MRRFLALALLVLSIAVPASASSISFGFTNGTRSASAVFANGAAGELVVTLTNTSGADAMAPIDILTTVFFDLAGSPTLTPLSALCQPNCAVYNDGSATIYNSLNVGGEWAYMGGLATSFSPNPHYGIGSSGLGLFPANNPNFNGPNLDGSSNGDLAYGITTAGDVEGTGNSPMTTRPLLQAPVVFTLTGFNLNAALSVSNVFFQYGTDLGEPRFQGVCLDCGGSLRQTAPVPEPASLALLGSGLIGVAARWRRKNARRT